MLLCYITDRRSLAVGDAQQRSRLRDCIVAAALAGVDYIQLREKDLPPCELEKLGGEAVRAVHENSSVTKILINGRTDVALACGADGVHLPSGELTASEARTLWVRGRGTEPVIAVSAHSLSEVRNAESHGADFALLAPIFEKINTSAMGIGLDILRAASTSCPSPDSTEAAPGGHFPVLALGGVTVANARNCLRAGAAGVAGIRLFQNGDVASTVQALRSISAP